MNGMCAGGSPPVSAASSAQQQDQDDQRNRNADQPEKNGHVIFLSGLWRMDYRAAYRIVLRRHVPSRRPPPSVAARLAQNAPISSDAVSQNASCAAALRAASMSALACVTTSLTRLSASAWLRPDRAATTFETYSRSAGFRSPPLRRLAVNSRVISPRESDALPSDSGRSFVQQRGQTATACRRNRPSVPLRLADETAPCVAPVAHRRAELSGRRQQNRSQHGGKRPGHESVGGIAEIHFVAVNPDPARAQAARNIAADR